jgi:hypothetical protein
MVLHLKQAITGIVPNNFKWSKPDLQEMKETKAGYVSFISHPFGKIWIYLLFRFFDYQLL